MTVKILLPSLDDIDDTTVLRGVIARESVDNLKVDFYQREKMSTASRSDIRNAFETGGRLPDVDLGMRGDHWQMSDNNEVLLLDPVYIIDGYQRISTLREYIAKFPESKARIGAVIHFNTNANWERARFHKLNSTRAKLSPNVLLKNMKEDVPLLATLYGLTIADQDFPLQHRVTWTQTPGRQDLISALTYLRITLRLHSHLIPARYVSTVDGVMNTSGRLEDRLGIPMVRENAKTLWHFIDDTWGIKEHKIRSSLPYLQVQFLTVLVDILADHIDFWVQPKEFKLAIPYQLKAKLKKLPVYDPEIVRLSGSSGKARETLYFIMTQHINSGKRTNRLVPRNVRAGVSIMEEDDGDEEGCLNQSDFDIIVARLPEMTKQQMTDLRRRLLFFMGSRDSSIDQDWLLAGILDVIRERGMGNMIPPNFRIKNTKSFGEYETQADRVRELLSDAIPNMTLTEQRTLGILSARALAIYLSKFTDVSLHNMLFYVARIPEAIDDSYPNYLASGTLAFIIRHAQ